MRRNARWTFWLLLLPVIQILFFHATPARAELLKADKVVVIKSKRVLILMRNGEIYQTYRIALGQKPKGAKVREGDKRTPEGRYVIDSRNEDSKFHLAMHISYPNEQDELKARNLGVSPGGSIMIHGLPRAMNYVEEYHRITDWTDGCIALTNREMEEIWKLVPDGTPIEIRP